MPLWRSFDVFEGPIEYFSQGSQIQQGFRNLIYFEKDVVDMGANNSGTVNLW